MENDDQVGLSDIIDILNTLDNQPAGLEQNASPIGVSAMSPLSSSAGELSKKQHLPSNSQTQAHSRLPPQVITKPEPTTTTSSGAAMSSKKPKPYIKILEQPDGKIVRFRYKCEGRSAGSIPGVNSTPENKTYPSIEIVGYKGEVVIVVSCVTKDPPYRPHPHNLVGKEGCKNGICTLVLNGEPLRAVFSNLGIQCVKRNDVKKALDEREELKVDPFKTKFAHKDQPSSIDLNAVRLCFQAFLKTPDGVKVLTPVVSDPIYHRKSISDLTISRLCSCSAKVSGGDEIILLCEKVTKDDIKIRFYELSADGSLLWEDFAEFQHTDIHKQTAIAFKTPHYHSSAVSSKAKVFIQLLRPSDGATGKPLPFEYYPDPDNFKRKRIKTGGNTMNILRRELQKHEQLQSTKMQNDFQDPSTTGGNFWRTSLSPGIKTEPTMSPLPFGPHRSPYQLASPSPQPPSPINRLDTPSPGLMKALSASSQSQMCDMFAYNAGLKEQKAPSLYQPEEQRQHNKHTNIGAATNPFGTNFNITTSANTSTNSSDSDFNNFTSLSTQQSPLNGMNIFIDHQTRAPSTSGGSITPIWNMDVVQNNPLAVLKIPQPLSLNREEQQQELQLRLQQLPENQNQPELRHHHHHRQQLAQPYQQQDLQFCSGQQQHSQQPQQQQQQLEQQQLAHDIEMLVNATATEECPTLSGLLAYVDGDQLMNINSEDLPLSNLSIST